MSSPSTSLTTSISLTSTERLILQAVRAWAQKKSVPTDLRARFLAEGVSALLGPLETFLATLMARAFRPLCVSCPHARCPSPDELKIFELIRQSHEGRCLETKLRLMHWVPACETACCQEALHDVSKAMTATERLAR